MTKFYEQLGFEIDWNDAPEWAKYFATDWRGYGCFCENEPRWSNDGFDFVIHGKSFYVSKYFRKPVNEICVIRKRGEE